MIKPLFTELIQLLLKQNYISMENYFLDGIKIEANANKYSFVWKKATDKYEEKLQDKIKLTFQQIEEAIELDEQLLMNPEESVKKITSVQLAEVVKQVEKQVESVFGHIKGNRSFRRFSLRGLAKVTIEFGLVAIAHNFLKQAEKNRSFEEENLKNRKTHEENLFSPWVLVI
ncbi:transposase [Bacillus sp. JJ864]|uniref:transposase n=1 Tax=Bacillus sp. JJ864 TaxID=3122975 RepID=UPI003F68AA17